MAQITQPAVGQTFWTLVNGGICQRIYLGPGTNGGHILTFPGKSQNTTPYFTDFLYAFENKSDILALHLDSARREAERAAALVPLVELEYRNALKVERETEHLVDVDQAS